MCVCVCVCVGTTQRASTHTHTHTHTDTHTHGLTVEAWKDQNLQGKSSGLETQGTADAVQLQRPYLLEAKRLRAQGGWPLFCSGLQLIG